MSDPTPSDREPSDTPTPVIERRAPRWMKLLLVASLGVNLVVIGGVTGLALRGDAHDGPVRALRDGAIPLAQALEPEQRREIGREIRRDLRVVDTGPRDRRAQYDDMLRMLRSEEFDAMDFAAHLQDQADRGLIRIKTSQAALIRHLQGLSLAERQAYANRVEALLEKRLKGPSRP